jgi:CBS domain-containing protein
MVISKLYNKHTTKSDFAQNTNDELRLCDCRMTPAPLTVEPDILIPKALEILRSNRFRYLPVIDKDWYLIGSKMRVGAS